MRFQGLGAMYLLAVSRIILFSTDSRISVLTPNHFIA
ncbi:hypothetical protein BC777_2661 [Yoonia maricola]|uniref:Uncharacterized protein n=1 Tax=Yoonia maricola TaxID=420999 RepID=A0A2M8W5U7_9RHOB|nr:hypothetical protein BC777_2661 [Yoonia maricola]